MKLTFRKSYVAYLDVLGFKDMVKKNRKNEIEKYFNVLNEEIDNLRKIEEKSLINFLIVSDSVVLEIPLETNDKTINVNQLRQLCIAIGKIQERLALENIWIRGAVSYGDTYFDNSKGQIVGQAYIDAYLLQEEIAINPRVIIDSKIINDLGFSSSQELIWVINTQQHEKQESDWGDKVIFSWESNNVSAINTISQDVPLFIDYFYRIISNKDYDKLTRIIENIKKNIYSEIRIYTKYRWIVNYLRSITSVHYEGSEIANEVYQQLMVL